MTLGEKLQELRKINRMSQEKMAELVGVSRQAVSKWENGTSYPTTENLISLAKLFNVSVEQLAHPDTHVELVLNVKKEVLAMRGKSKAPLVVIGIMLLLGLCTFATAFIGSMTGRFSDNITFALMCVTVVLIFAAVLPIFIKMLRYVYNDCKQRGIKPTFWVIASATWLGLFYYFTKRDQMSAK